MVRFDRLEGLIKEQGKTKTFICGKAGKKRNYISDAQNGNGSISDEALAIFARELGTTVAYLTGESDEVRVEEKPAEAQSGLGELSKEELDYISWFRERATEKEKEIVRLIVNGKPGGQ